MLFNCKNCSKDFNINPPDAQELMFCPVCGNKTAVVNEESLMIYEQTQNSYDAIVYMISGAQYKIVNDDVSTLEDIINMSCIGMVNVTVITDKGRENFYLNPDNIDAVKLIGRCDVD